MDLRDELIRLKNTKNAIILAHYYCNDKVQDIADYIGDSYYLSKIAKESDSDIIVFCGVMFMAHSAKLLSPNKKVLIPNEQATCDMATAVNVDKVKELQRTNDNATTVSYINCTTELKAISDVCVTSSSAEKIINNIDNNSILFIPDKNLGTHIKDNLPDKDFILWDGCCPIHNNVTKGQMEHYKNKYPNSKVLVHPECNEDVRLLADYIGSTSGIIDYATNDKGNEFIIVTDTGIMHQLQKQNPDKIFHSLPIECPSMKLTSLEDIYNCLINETNEVVIEPELANNAVKALENMHHLATKGED